MRLTAWQSRLREMPTQNLKAETNASGYRGCVAIGWSLLDEGENLKPPAIIRAAGENWR
jgi:hypothetical protein